MFSRFGADARRFLGSAVAEGFFNGVSRMARLHPQSRPHRHAVEHLRDIRYLDGTMREHLLDVYRPARATTGSHASAHRRYQGPPWPIVFYVHGGGFRISPRTRTGSWASPSRDAASPSST